MSEFTEKFDKLFGNKISKNDAVVIAITCLQKTSHINNEDGDDFAIILFKNANEKQEFFNKFVKDDINISRRLKEPILFYKDLKKWIN